MVRDHRLASCVAGVVVMALLAGCGGDGGGEIGRFRATPRAGSWVGEWNNQTFGTSGNADLQVTVHPQAKTMEMVIDIDGNALGGTDPDPITLTGSYDDDGLTIQETGAAFGDISVTVTSLSTVTGSVTNLPNDDVDRIEFTGRWTDQSVTVDYAIAFTNGSSATGTFTLTKQ